MDNVKLAPQLVSRLWKARTSPLPIESKRWFVQHAVGAARDVDYAFLALDFEALGVGIIVGPQSHLQR